MLSKKRIKIIIQLALYEKDEGREDLKNVRYYKNDYVRLNILKSIISMTFGYLIILCMIAMYNLEYLITNAVTLPYKSMILTAVGVYILLMMFYVFITVILYALRYDASKKRVKKYFKYLKYLLKQYQSDNDNETGKEA